MEVTAVPLRDTPALRRGRPGDSPSSTAARPDNKELRRVLRSVRKIANGDGHMLWQPVHPGGPSRFDHYHEVLFSAFRSQLPSSIRRLKASKPIAVKTRKVVAAMLALARFQPDEFPR